MAVPSAQPAILGPSFGDLAQAVQEFMHDSGGGAFAAPPLPMQQQVVLAQPGLEEMLEEHMENVNVTDLLSAEGDPMSSPNGVASSSGDVEPVRPSVAPDPTVIPSGLFESPQVVRPSAAPPVPSVSPARRPRPEPDLNTSHASQDRVRQRIDAPMDISAFDPMAVPSTAPPLPLGARPCGLELIAPPPAPSSAVEFAPMQAARAGSDLASARPTQAARAGFDPASARPSQAARAGSDPASARLPHVMAFDLMSDASHGDAPAAAASDPSGSRAPEASTQVAWATAGGPSVGPGAVVDAPARWAAEKTVLHLPDTRRPLERQPRTIND